MTTLTTISIRQFNLQLPIATTTSGYHPYGGVQVFPTKPSPQIKRKAVPTRPISFVRALDMANSIEMEMQERAAANNDPNKTVPTQIKNNGVIGSSAINNNGGNQPNNTQKSSTTPTPDRASVYDVNYEISV